MDPDHDEDDVLDIPDENDLEGFQVTGEDGLPIAEEAEHLEEEEEPETF